MHLWGGRCFLTNAIPAPGSGALESEPCELKENRKQHSASHPPRAAYGTCVAPTRWRPLPGHPLAREEPVVADRQLEKQLISFSLREKD